MEKSKKNCNICGEKTFFSPENEYCKHIYHVNCLIKHIKESIEANSYIKCPSLECQKKVSFIFLQKVLEKEKEILSFIKDCSNCSLVYPKDSMKRQKCKHYTCRICCASKQDCSKCLKSQFLHKHDKNCDKCREQHSETLILSDCQHIICIPCFSKHFEKQMANCENENFSFVCPKKNCKVNVNFDDNLLQKHLEKKVYLKYNKQILNRYKCKLCKQFKNKENFVALNNCWHKICEKCLFEYCLIAEPKIEKNKKKQNLICPVEKCSEIIESSQIKEILVPIKCKKESKKSQNFNENKNSISKKEGQFKENKFKKFNKTRGINKEEASIRLSLKSTVTVNLSESFQIFYEKKSPHSKNKIEVELKENSSLDSERSTKKVNLRESKDFNKNEIVELHKTEKYEYSQAQNEIKWSKLLTDICEICLDRFNIKDMLTMDCEHRFCQPCLVQDWTIKIHEGLIAKNHLICPKEGCKKPIDYYILQGNLPENIFKKYDELLANHTISNITNSEGKAAIYKECQNKYILDKKNQDLYCEKLPNYLFVKKFEENKNFENKMSKSQKNDCNLSENKKNSNFNSLIETKMSEANIEKEKKTAILNFSEKCEICGEKNYENHAFLEIRENYYILCYKGNQRINCFCPICYKNHVKLELASCYHLILHLQSHKVNLNSNEVKIRIYFNENFGNIIENAEENSDKCEWLQQYSCLNCKRNSFDHKMINFNGRLSPICQNEKNNGEWFLLHILNCNRCFRNINAYVLKMHSTFDCLKNK